LAYERFSRQGWLVYDRCMGDRAAFVLAGGQSTRMGADKAFVEFEGRTLLAHALGFAKCVASDVWIVGSREKFTSFGGVVVDEYQEHGPLAGIHAALRSSPSELNLMLAVDMPFLEVPFLEYLFQEAARHESAMVTIPRAAGAWQTLCAVYRKPFADLAELALREWKNKIDPLFRGIEMRIVEEHELTQQNFSPTLFRNLNTMEELKQASKH
jgi:molybdopterin-guanine dinucleotide biosynthesis protein A